LIFFDFNHSGSTTIFYPSRTEKIYK